MSKVSEAHLDARRRSIIDAACRAFSEKGVETATMAEVAARAGISAGAIYRYFENKEALARACLSESSEAILEQWVTSPDSSQDPARELSNFARLTFKLLNEPTQRPDTILHLERLLTLARDEDARALSELRDEFAKVTFGIESRLKLAQKAGQLGPDMDPHALAGMLFSLYWGARIAKLVDPAADTDSQIAAVSQVLWGPAATAK